MTAWYDHHLLSHLSLPHLGYRPEPGCVDLWVLHTDPDTVLAAHRLVAVLDARERQWADTMPTQDARNKCLVSRIALRLILGQCLRTTPNGVRLAHGRCPSCGRRHGKLVPVGAPGLHVSCSGARNTVMVTLASAAVGVAISADEQMPGCSDAYPQPDGRPAIGKPGAARNSRSRPACRVREMSYFKAVGAGLCAPPHASEAGPRLGSGIHADVPAGWTVTSLAAPAGHVAALTLHTPVGQPDTRIRQHGCGTCRADGDMASAPVPAGLGA
ncbi:hypothetical protein AB0N20_15790 [Streptomyces griseoincarnatus]